MKLNNQYNNFQNNYNMNFMNSNINEINLYDCFDYNKKINIQI